MDVKKTTINERKELGGKKRKLKVVKELKE